MVEQQDAGSHYFLHAVFYFVFLFLLFGVFFLRVFLLLKVVLLGGKQLSGLLWGQHPRTKWLPWCVERDQIILIQFFSVALSQNVLNPRDTRV